MASFFRNALARFQAFAAEESSTEEEDSDEADVFEDVDEDYPLTPIRAGTVDSTPPGPGTSVDGGETSGGHPDPPSQQAETSLSDTKPHPFKRKHSWKKKITETLSHVDFEKCEPDICVGLLKIPSMSTYSALKRKMKMADQAWVEGFLESGGLSALLEYVDMIGSKRVTQLSDALLLLECVSCIKGVLNTRLGVDYLINHVDYTRKLVKALDTNNVMVKKQVVELLSALCLYSQDGYKLAVAALESFKVTKKQRYRFSLVMNELKAAEIVPYKTTLLAFINCVIVATEELEERMSIRNEFLGLNLLDLIVDLRNEDDDDLNIQCDVFEEEKQSDDDTFTSCRTDVIDINSHKEVFNAVFQKVYNTPQADALLTILQTLLNIDPQDELSDGQWSLLQEVARLALLMDKKTQPDKIIARVKGHHHFDNLPSVERSVQTDLPITNGQSELDDSPKSRNAPRVDSGYTSECSPDHQVKTIYELKEWQENKHGAGDGNKQCIEQVIQSQASRLLSAAAPTQRLVNGDSQEGLTNGVQSETNIPQKLSDNHQLTPGTGDIPPPPPAPQIPRTDIPPAPPAPQLPGTCIPPPLLASPLTGTGISQPPPAPPLPGDEIPPPPPAPPLPGTGSVPPPPSGIPAAPPPPPLPGVPGAPPPPPPPPPLPGIPAAPPPPGAPPPPPPPPGIPGAPPPPPPPPPPGIPGAPPPPPPPPPGVPGAPPLPPPAPGFGTSSPFQYQPPNRVRGIRTPTPTTKLRTFNWTKVPPQVVSSSKNTVWKEVLGMTDKVTVKYDDIEKLFSQKKVEKSAQPETTKKKAPTEVTLLDMKTSMAVNIFLKQFKMSNEAVVDLIRGGEQDKIGPERLRGLQKLLPRADEIEMVTGYDGDKDKLGNAEKFFLQLSKLEHFKLRVDGMVLKDEFRTSIETLKPDVTIMTRACERLMNSPSLKDFLRFVLHTGNFLNAGGYAGNAVGFKINSLNKLMDTRANKPRVTLLHFLVSEVEKENKDVLNFAEELLPDIAEASRLTVDGLSGETSQLTAAVKKLDSQVSGLDNEIKNQFTDFIEKATVELEKIQTSIGKINSLAKELALHFCENESSFKVEECLNNFKTFCEKLQQCKKENDQRRIQEEKAEKRKKEREALVKSNKGKSVSKLPVEEDGCIIDKLLGEIRKGTKLRKNSPNPDSQSLKSKS